jgi:hypothetical protein
VEQALQLGVCQFKQQLEDVECRDFQSLLSLVSHVTLCVDEKD